MARNEIILEEDAPRDKVVIGVPETVAKAWAEVQEQAKGMRLGKAVGKALGERVAEAIDDIRRALNAKANAVSNGHSLVER